MKSLFKLVIGFFITLLIFSAVIKYWFIDKSSDRHSQWHEEVQLSNGKTIWVNRVLVTKLEGDGSHFGRGLKKTSIRFDDSKVGMPSDWFDIYEPLILDVDKNNEWFIIALCCTVGLTVNSAYMRLSRFDYSEWRNHTNYIEYRFKEGEWSQFPVRQEFIKSKLVSNLMTNIVLKQKINKNSKITVEHKRSNKNLEHNKLYVCLSDKPVYETSCD